MDRKCKCGGRFVYDGYDNIEIEDDCLVIRGDCTCNKCKKEATYEEWYKVDLSKPISIDIEEEQ